MSTQKETLPSVANCELLEKIADSGMGAVYKGRNRATGQIVAVKVMPPFEAGKEQAFQRFARECRILSALKDPHIVRALDFGMEGLSPYLVMEFVEGESLGRRVTRAGALPEAEAIRLISQVAGALDRAHGRGLVHRNVKPDNILITANGQGKLTDLGLVKEVETQHAGVTCAGTFLGTPNFMAPEQFFNSSNATKSCDIYSLAASLYMAVTGELPFGGCKVAGMWTKKLRNDCPAPKQLAPTLSDRTDLAIRRAMSTEPENRPATCAEFVEDLTGDGEIKLPTRSAEPAREQPAPEPVQSPAPPAATEDYARLVTIVAPKALLVPAQGDSDGEGSDWMTLLAGTSLAIAGFVSGLYMLAR